jgi:molybdate transport system ATP-binding protein
VSAGLHAEVLARRGRFELHVDLEVANRHTLVVLGQNGSGKSSLVDALAGLLPLERGRVELNGRLLDQPQSGLHVAPHRRDLGVVLQGTWLMPWLRVRDEVAFGLRARGLRRHEAYRRITPLLERLALSGLSTRRCSSLSGGERQRVALARALAISPAALVLDEPLGALDVDARHAARELLREHLEGFGGPRLLVTHDATEAWALGDSWVVLEGGRVAQRGTPEEICRRPRCAHAAAIAGVTLLRGTLTRDDTGGCQIDLGHAYLPVPRTGLDPGTEVFAAVAPRAVELSAASPDGAGWREMRVRSVELEGDVCSLALDGKPGLRAKLETRVLRRDALRPGVRAFARIDPQGIEVYPVSA